VEPLRQKLDVRALKGRAIIVYRLGCGLDFVPDAFPQIAKKLLQGVNLLLCEPIQAGFVQKVA
jgi:hypothetical protein